MSSEKAVALVVDHPQRDLAGLTLTAVALCRAGIKCFLVPFNMMAKEIWALRPNFVMLNYLRSTTERTVEGLRRAGIGYGVLDTEGAIWSSAEQYGGLLAPTPAIRSDLSRICMWGHELASYVVKNHYFRDDQVCITGCPRFDFYAPQWRSVLSHGDCGAQNRTILINTNYSTVNSRYKTLEQTVALYRTGMDDGEIQSLIASESEGLAQTLDLVEYVSAAFKNCKIVLRPHPFEDASVYRNRLGCLENVEINTEGTVQPQLFKSHVLIQRSCTTAVEAYMASIPTLSPQWVTPAFVVPMAEAVSVPCGTASEMKDHIENILADSYHLPEAVRQSGERVVEGWFHKNDGCAHERVSRAIATIKDWERTPDEASCSRLLYELDAPDETIWAKMAARTRYQTGLPPHWSFTRLRDVSPETTRPGKAFGASDVRELAAKIVAAEAAQGQFGEAISVQSARESGAYSHGFQGVSVELKQTGTSNL